MKNKQNNRAHTASVQTARATSPYKVLDRYVPLSKPEFAVYDAIREAVPMVDAAILKIVRLVDNFNISCSDIKVEKDEDGQYPDTRISDIKVIKKEKI